MKIIIKENQQKLLSMELQHMIKKYGMDVASIAVGGKEKLIELLNMDSPMDFLHLFDDLEQVQSEGNKDWILFRYRPEHNLMVYNKSLNYIDINYHEIWSVLVDNFGLNDRELKKLTQEWLSSVYNLRGVEIQPAFYMYG